jgi:putative endonuclease
LKGGARQERGQKARRDGRRAEWLAAFFLMATGWRILGFRLKTPGAELDLVARRGGVIAIIEVKRRRTLDEALIAVGPDQKRRLKRAADQMAARYGGVARLDLLAMTPGRLPRHVPDAWPDL